MGNHSLSAPHEDLEPIRTISEILMGSCKMFDFLIQKIAINNRFWQGE